jgi:hypothetical protein
MAFMTYLARHNHHQNQQQLLPQTTEQPNTTNTRHINKRSLTLPTVSKQKKKEIGDYILCRTIGRGASGKFSKGDTFIFFPILIYPLNFVGKNYPFFLYLFDNFFMPCLSFLLPP